MQNLVSDLRSFKLSGMAFSLEERLIYAQTNKLSYREFLELLCDDEKGTRKDNNYKRRKNAAKLPSIKRLEDFDFAFPNDFRHFLSTQLFPTAKNKGTS